MLYINFISILIKEGGDKRVHISNLWMRFVMYVAKLLQTVSFGQFKFYENCLCDLLLVAH